MRSRAIALACVVAFTGQAAVLPSLADAKCKTIYCIPTASHSKRAKPKPKKRTAPKKHASKKHKANRHR